MMESIINSAKSHESLSWETGKNWRKWVSEPVIKYPLAPRHARAILQVFGELALMGLDVMEIIEQIWKDKTHEPQKWR